MHTTSNRGCSHSELAMKRKFKTHLFCQMTDSRRTLVTHSEFCQIVTISHTHTHTLKLTSNTYLYLYGQDLKHSTYLSVVDNILHIWLKIDEHCLHDLLSKILLISLL